MRNFSSIAKLMISFLNKR